MLRCRFPYAEIPFKAMTDYQQGLRTSWAEWVELVALVEEEAAELLKSAHAVNSVCGEGSMGNVLYRSRSRHEAFTDRVMIP